MSAENTTPRGIISNPSGRLEWRLTVTCMTCGHAETMQGAGSVSIRQECPRCGSAAVQVSGAASQDAPPLQLLVEPPLMPPMPPMPGEP